MGGFKAVTGQGTTMYADNVDFTGNAIAAPQVTLDGQLLIGSTATPNIKVGTLTSSDSSITITNGSGTISLTVAGGGTVGKTITGNSGGALSPTAGNWNILGTGSITTSGAGSTLTAQLTGLTNHNVLIGAGTATITNVAPSATSGVALISQGAAADPVFGTVVVAGGGTGAVTLTGVLTGNGTSAVTASTVTQHGVLVGGASNAVSSTAVGSTGQVLQANSAADPTYSTATYPSVATGTGTILRADGTNWVATTATYPATTTVSQILYSSSTNVVGGLATANSGVLTTGATGIPVITALASDGQLIIGSSAGAPAAATISAGTNISVTNGHNTITIAATGQASLAWTDNSGTFTAVSNHGYFITAASTPTLPSTPSEGDMIYFVVDTASTCTITGNTGQLIRIGAGLSAAAGTAANNARGDSILLVYRSTGTTWFSAGAPEGTWTVT